MMAAPIRSFFFAPDLPREQASARYKKLALALHPDTETGDTVLMQQLNIEYEAFTAGRLLPPAASYTAPPPPPTNDRADQLRAAAEALIAELPTLPGVRFVFASDTEEILVRGRTFNVKETLKAEGFRWDADRYVWWMRVTI